MSWFIFLLDVIFLLQLKCTMQSTLEMYPNKPHGSYDSGHLLSMFKSDSLQDDKYHNEDYDNMDNVKSILGKPGLDYPILDKVPETSFSCEARPEGYYADPETGCQVFHICLTQSVKSSFLCPNGSIFNQELSTCDWWNRVDCRFSESIHLNKNYSQAFIRKKIQSTSEKFNNIVEDIQFGKDKNTNNTVFSELNDSKGSELISTSWVYGVTQPTINKKFLVIKPVVTTQQTKSNIIENDSSYLELPTQYKCCNNSEVSKLSELFQVHLLHPKQMKSTTSSMSQYGQFTQVIQDSSTPVPLDSLHQDSKHNIMLSQQKINHDDSSVFPISEPYSSNKKNVMNANLQFHKNFQSSVSSIMPVHTVTSKTSQKSIADSLNLDQRSFQNLSNPFVMNEQVTDLFDGLYNPSTKFSFPLTLGITQPASSNMLQQPQQSTPSTVEPPVNVSLSEQEQRTTNFIYTSTTTTTAGNTSNDTTMLKQLQHATLSTLEMPQDTLPNTSEQKQHKNLSIMELLQHSTVGKMHQSLNTSVNILQLPQQLSSSNNLYNKDNHKRGNYENSSDLYSFQTISDISAATRAQSGISEPVDKCNFTKNCFYINYSEPSNSEITEENSNHFNNTVQKNLFVLDTLINPFKKENAYEIELNATECKQNKNENNKINTDTNDFTDLNKSKNTHLPIINRASTPLPLRHTEILQYPYTHSAQYKTLIDINRESTQNAKTLNFKVSDILNLNNFNSVSNQHPLSERASSYSPTIVKSIGFNFDTEEGRKEFDLAVSSGFFSEV